MSTYQSDRENFLLTMQAEGMAPDIARRILRHANTIQRCAALACSSEAADRDRVTCPTCKGKPHTGADHPPGEECRDVTRIQLAEERAERLIRAWCDKAGAYRAGTIGDPVEVRSLFTPDFQGDPRGACVKIKVPSGKTDDGGRTGICVPTRRY